MRPTQPPETPQPVAARTPEPVTAIAYRQVRKNNLFSPDRNSDVVVAGPPEQLELPTPPLPVFYGIAALPGGTRALMAEKKGAITHIVRVGDGIGQFTIVALGPQFVTFGWNGKEIRRGVDDLMGRGALPAAFNAGVQSCVGCDLAKVGTPPKGWYGNPFASH